MRPPRYITASSTEISALKKELHLPDSRQEIVRIEGLLLNIRNYKASEIAQILEVDYDTVIEWFNRWESSGLAGLLNKPKSGHPPIFEEEEKK